MACHANFGLSSRLDLMSEYHEWAVHCVDRHVVVVQEGFSRHPNWVLDDLGHRVNFSREADHNLADENLRHAGR